MTDTTSNKDKFDEVKKQTLLLNLNEIFNGKRCFRIPDFQRGYSWTKAEREDLCKDIMTLPLNSFSTQLPLHYTGMITLNEPSIEKKDISYNEEGVSSSSFDMYYIIDGQQRLTSLIIFINEIIKYANNENINLENNLANDELYKKFISNNNFLYLNYSKKRQNQDEIDCLMSILINEENDYSQSYYNINLKNAQDDFKAFLDKLKEDYSQQFEQILKSTFRKITKQLVFNIYYVSKDFDICTTFETMNNRGKQLSNLELLKNRLLYLSTILECQNYSEQEIISLRENINKTWGEIYKNLGTHNNALDDDEFLKAHWISYFGLTKQKGDDYANDLLNQKFAITSNISPDDINNYCNSLKKCSKEWIYINFQLSTCNFHKEILAYITKISHLNVTLYIKSYLLSIVSYCKKIDTNIINNHLKNLERFIFIRKYIGSKKTDYGWLGTYAHDIKVVNSTDKILDILNEVNSTIENNEDYGLNKINQSDRNSFIEDITTKFQKGKGFYEWNGIYYFLYEYNLHLAEKSKREEKEKELVWDLFTDSNNSKSKKLTIEHILPQTPNDYWKECFKNHLDTISLYTNSLGNLLPLARGINSKMQNHCYIIKREGCQGLDRTSYNEGSLSEIKVSSEYTLWSAKNIKTRSEELINFMNKNWNLKLTDKDIQALVYVNPKEETIDEDKLTELANIEKSKLQNSGNSSKGKIVRKKKSSLNENEYWETNKDKPILDFAKKFRTKIKEYLTEENIQFEEYFKNDYIGYKIKNINNTLFFNIHIHQKNLKLLSKIPNFDHSIPFKNSQEKTNWSLRHQMYIENFDYLEDIKKIIKFSYEQVKENKK